jgi:hypothetical protein
MSGQSAQLTLREACEMQERIQHASSQACSGKNDPHKGGRASSAGKRMPTKYGEAGKKQEHQG